MKRGKTEELILKRGELRTGMGRTFWLLFVSLILHVCIKVWSIKAKLCCWKHKSQWEFNIYIYIFFGYGAILNKLPLIQESKRWILHFVHSAVAAKRILNERLRWKNVLICIRQTSIVLFHPGCLSLITSTDLTLRFWLLMTVSFCLSFPPGLVGLSREFDLFILFTTWRINCSRGLYSYSWEQTDCFQRFWDCAKSFRTTGKSLGFLWMWFCRKRDLKKLLKLKALDNFLCHLIWFQIVFVKLLLIL